MAKWGEGDPRWIVEERPDATNVNNWHWTEKNATPWSKERIAQLFKDFKIEGPEGLVCNVHAVEKCSGEATANNRKGKLIFFYDWEVVLNWTGCLENASKAEQHNGKITIPNLSEENDLDEVEITVTIDESNDESETLKQFMYNVGRDRIREVLGVYIKELKEEFSNNLILPKKGEDGKAVPTTQKDVAVPNNTSGQPATKTENASAANAVNARLAATGCKLDVRTLNMTEEFQCSPNDLYNALTKVEMLSAFTRAPAKVDASRGGEFVLYGGSVHGKFEELVPEKKIAQTWRLKNWPSGHYSHVSITLEETKSKTKMSLTQSGIPASEFDTMGNNWHRYYWGSIKQTFGFGATLLDSL